MVATAALKSPRDDTVGMPPTLNPVRNCGRTRSLSTNVSAVVENGAGTATVIDRPL